jgi:serine phosphatase RsbU (regulator of sigma subunit)/tetratricopeptide (TPR) repeat protein
MMSRLAVVIFFLSAFCGTTLRAQPNNIVPPAKRSIAELQALPDDTTKVLYFHRVGWDTSYYNLALGLEYAQEGLRIARQLNWPRGIVLCLNGVGTSYNDLGEFDEALAAHMEGLTIAEKAGMNDRVATALMNISLVYNSIGDKANAIRYLDSAVVVFGQTENKRGLAFAYINLGGTAFEAEMTQKSLESYTKARDLGMEIDNKMVQAHGWAGMAVCEADSGSHELAVVYITEALKIADSLDDYERAQIQGRAATTYREMQDYASSEKYYRMSMGVFKAVGVRDELVGFYRSLSEVFEMTNRPDSALLYFKMHMALQDSIVNEDVLSHQRNLEAKYESEKQKQQIELLTSKADTRQWFLVAIIVAFVILVFLVIMLYKRNQFRKNTNLETARQSREIEEKNRSITDSINYASRIQDAVVPSIEQMRRHFSDAFVLSRPKDIVSGDFWWCSEQNGEFLLAGADSTGHGVPGGFMSMLGSVFLFEIITEKKISSPAEILNQLRDKVISALSRSGMQHSSLKDGMDMVMCSFSADKKKLRFACAMNPLWVIRRNTVIEYRADKFPVGEYIGDVRPFTQLEHECEPGDMIYIFSDGYADQFGGPDGKKLKYKQLRDILCAFAGMPCDAQKRALEEKFTEWKGHHDQVDDVLIIGIRI